MDYSEVTFRVFGCWISFSEQPAGSNGDDRAHTRAFVSDTRYVKVRSVATWLKKAGFELREDGVSKLDNDHVYQFEAVKYSDLKPSNAVKQ